MNTLASPLVRYGFTAGAEGAGAIHAVGAGEEGAPATGERSAPVTIESALAALREAKARFVLAELADTSEFAPLRAALEVTGFAEVGRVPDFVRDGVALVILRRD